MSNGDSHGGAPDRISLQDDYEKRYWMKTLRVSEEALTEAVQEVGHAVQKVREYLRPGRPRR